MAAIAAAAPTKNEPYYIYERDLGRHSDRQLPRNDTGWISSWNAFLNLIQLKPQTEKQMFDSLMVKANMVEKSYVGKNWLDVSTRFVGAARNISGYLQLAVSMRMVRIATAAEASVASTPMELDDEDGPDPRRFRVEVDPATQAPVF